MLKPKFNYCAFGCTGDNMKTKRLDYTGVMLWR